MTRGQSVRDAQDDDSPQGPYQFMGWRQPRALTLGALVMLGSGMLIGSSLIVAVSCVSGLWTLRRISITLSPHDEVTLTYSLIIPYRRVRLPLLSTYVFTSQRMTPYSVAVISTLISVYKKTCRVVKRGEPKFSLILQRSLKSHAQRPCLHEVYLAHPRLQNPIALMTLAAEDTKTIKYWLSQTLITCRRAQIGWRYTQPLNLSRPRRRWVDWMIRRCAWLRLQSRDGVIHTRLSWWRAPRVTLWMGAWLSVVTLGLCITPLFCLCVLGVWASALLSARYVISVHHLHVEVQERVLGIPLRVSVLHYPLSVELSRDLEYPTGRAVVVSGTQDRYAHVWPCAEGATELYSAFVKAVVHHTPAGLNPRSISSHPN